MRKILIITFLLVGKLYAQTTGYLKQEIIRVPGVTSETQIPTLTSSQKSTTYSYHNGMGHLGQQVIQQASPAGFDIVLNTRYEGNGKPDTAYLPYVAAATNGAYKHSFKKDQFDFYYPVPHVSNSNVARDAKAYAVVKYESSPFARILESGNYGGAFQPGSGKTDRYTYSMNVSTDAVRKFNSDGTSSTTYGVNTLYKNTITNAQGSHTIVFTDLAGRILLKKQQIDETIDGVMVPYLETYYIYDDFNRIKFIISPKGVEALKANSWVFSAAVRDQYVYEFTYNRRGNIAEKKVPGQLPEYYCYDKLNRLVLVQDGLMRSENKWIFVKYDRKGRAVMNGIYLNTAQTSRASLQLMIDGLYSQGNTDYPQGSQFELRGNELHGYTNRSFPKKNQDASPLTVWTVNYYETYDLDNNGTADQVYTPQGLANQASEQGRVEGLVTAAKYMEFATNTWLYKYLFYDKLGQLIQVKQNNHLNSTVDNIETFSYNFDGSILNKKNFHKAGTQSVTVLNKWVYDKGRLTDILQSLNGGGDQILAKYVYNEIGQLVDKKLHVNGASHLQSVDYRYNIRGWLTSINNAERSADYANDDLNDLFGLELVYDASDAQMGNTPRYDGNISAIKWKGPGKNVGASERSSFKFLYDKAGRMKSATSQVHNGSTWASEVGALNEVLSYDHNGNIKAIQRNQKKYAMSNNLPAYTSEQIDNLTFTYSTTQGDRLIKVDDSSNKPAGFNNGSTETEEYLYDVNGNLKADKNKGISNIKYTLIGKPEKVEFSDGRKIEYAYDALGNKIVQVNLQGTTVTSKTDYVNGFIYESGTLSYFSSPEGRVVKNGSAFEYQYAIADHQGNTRVVFSSATPAASASAANFESTTAPANPTWGTLSNYPTGAARSPLPLFNNTAGGTYSQLLNGAANYQVGIGSQTKRVYPGDKIKIEAQVKYEAGGSNGPAAFGAALLQAFGLSAPVAGEISTASTALTDWGALVDGGAQNSNTAAPKAFVNIIVFDKNYKFLDASWQQVSTNAQQVGASPDVPHELLVREYTIKEEGFVFMYVSNTSPVRVYFDDVKFTYTPTNVIQYNEYYPFGLQTSNSWTRAGAKDNDYLYNAGSELNNTTGWYEMFFRGYDPTIGRMLQVDPLAAYYHEYSPYNFAGNNPITFNDPTGASMSPMDKYWNDAMAAVSGSTYLGGESGGSGSSTTSGGNVSVLNIGGGYSIVVYWDEVPGIGATYSMENGHVRVQEFSSATLINDELFVTYANWYYDGNGKPITDNNVSATITSEFIEKFKIEFNAVADAQQGVGQSHASIVSGEVTLKDIVNYGLGGAGMVINHTAAELLKDRASYVAGKYSRDAVNKVKLIDKSLAGLDKTARKLGLAGLAINGVSMANNYFNGNGITASQAFDFAVGAALTFATITNPALLIGFGVYGILDAAGAFDGIKESLGGDTVILKRE